MKDFETLVIEAANEHPNSMRQAAKAANMPYRTFIERAKRLGVYKPNQSGKGLKKDASAKMLPLDSILAGQQPQYPTSLLKKRLFEAGIKESKCEQCGIENWLDKPLTMHLDHINGDSSDHKLSNLVILCPNCHSQTSTYAGRNKRKSGRKKIVDEDLVDALNSSDNVRQALLKVGLEPKGANYKRANRLKGV